MSTISSGTTSTTTLVHSGDTTGSLVFKTNDTGSGGTTAMTIDTSQNVGIGTSSPTTKLQVNTSSTADGITVSSGGTAYTLINSAGTDTNIVCTNNFVAKTNGSERMRIDNSGNVLIATTNAITGITGAQFTASNTSENPAYINIFRDDTTIGNGQFLGYLQFCGRDATSSLGTAHAYVAAVAEADHGAGDNATAITFGTTPDNNGSPEYAPNNGSPE